VAHPHDRGGRAREAGGEAHRRPARRAAHRCDARRAVRARAAAGRRGSREGTQALASDRRRLAGRLNGREPWAARTVELRIPDDASGSRTGGDPDTADLVRRAQQGDLAAFDRLYATHVDRVYALCLRMSGQREQAEQLTQDAFVRAWEKLRLFRGESAFGSWLYRLAINVVLEERRADRRRTAPLDADGDRVLETTPARTGAPDLRLDLERA